MLAEFRDYIIQKAVVRENQISYYLKWVSACYSHSEKVESEVLSGAEKEEFLKHLSKTHEDWQVDQADNALRLYDYFLSSAKIAAGGNVEGGSDADGWPALESQTREALRLRHRSYSTEKTYLNRLRAFRKFLDGKDPRQIDGTDIQRFLSHLAVERRVAPSTQNQALNAIVFFYRHALDKNLGENELKAVRAAPKRRLPVVLSAGEITALFDNLSGTPRFMAKLIYGCGLRLQECVRLRVKDIDLDRNIIVIRSGKGDQDRRTVMPESLKDELINHMSAIKEIYSEDRRKDIAGVYLPGALERKYPNAGKEWGWFWLFPAKSHVATKNIMGVRSPLDK